MTPGADEMENATDRAAVTATLMFDPKRTGSRQEAAGEAEAMLGAS